MGALSAELEMMFERRVFQKVSKGNFRQVEEESVTLGREEFEQFVVVGCSFHDEDAHARNQIIIMARTIQTAFSPHHATRREATRQRFSLKRG